MSWIGRLKQLTTVTGSLLPPGLTTQVSAFARYLALGNELDRLGFTFPSRVGTREEVFRTVAEIVGGRKVLYMEFGVYMGNSMRYWSRELKNPASHLHGFDSFEGLPVAGASWKKGQFNVQGQVPVIDDSRVRFFKGWFDATLPGYSAPEHDVLVLVLDADLYSSTACVLNHLRPLINSGSFIYFDELDQVDHELRAFREFIEESGAVFRPVCADRSLAHAFFQCESIEQVRARSS